MLLLMVFFKLVILLVVVVVMVVLERGDCGGGGGGDSVSVDERVDCNHGNAIDKYLKHACVRLDALVLQLLVCGGTNYGGGDCNGHDGVLE